VRNTVFAGNNVPRVNNVDFSIRVGVAIPERVRVVVVPEPLIEIHPEWRGHSYFVSGDDIIIVDSGHRIVSVVAVGTGGSTQLRDGGGNDNVTMQGQPSSEEIRQVQIALKEKGFAVEVDGTLGPRTRAALMAFQRREGLQATGQMDQRTFVSLGISSRSSGPTTGQSTAPNGQHEAQPRGGNEPSTTGQNPQANQPTPSTGHQTGQPTSSESPQNRVPPNRGGSQPSERMQNQNPAR